MPAFILIVPHEINIVELPVLCDGNNLEHAHYRADSCEAEKREEDYQQDLFGLR